MKKLIIALLFLPILSSFAQDSTLTRDFETWSSLGVQKKLFDKKLTLGLQQQFRIDNNSTRLYQYFTQLEASFEVFKGFKIGVANRFLKVGSKTKGFLLENRFNVDLGYKHAVNRFYLSYRVRYQYRSNSENKDYPTTKYRLRIKVAYNIKNWKFDPYFSTELFYANETYDYNYIPEVTETANVKGLQKYRLQIGTSYKTGKIGVVKLFYLVEHQFSNYATNYYLPVNWSVIGVGYTFKF